jgi:hypothetical protein
MRLFPALGRALLLGSALALAAVPGARAEAEDIVGPPPIYKWVDSNGVAHYTTDLGRVPRSVRGSVRQLGGSGSGEGYATRDVPPAGAKPAAEPVPEWDVGDAPKPAPPPARKGPEGWAGTDRPAALPPEEGAEESTQTAAAEPTPGSAEAEAEPAPSAAQVAAMRTDLDARIAALEKEIASDEGALKTFLAAPAPASPDQVAHDRSFREVAERLPGRLAELRSLQTERAQLDAP